MRLCFDFLWLIIFLVPFSDGKKNPKINPELIKDLANVGTAIIQSELDVALATAQGFKNVVNATAGLSATSLSLLSNLTVELVDASIALAEVIIEAKLNLAVPLIDAVENLTTDALEAKQMLLDNMSTLPKTNPGPLRSYASSRDILELYGRTAASSGSAQNNPLTPRMVGFSSSDLRLPPAAMLMSLSGGKILIQCKSHIFTIHFIS